MKTTRGNPGPFEVRRRVAALTLALALGVLASVGCSESSSTPPPPSSNWDEMKWDEGVWDS